jgi:hypothetical protein
MTVRSRGLVYIEPEYAARALGAPVEGHWEPLDRPPLDGPGWDDSYAAIAWGRARAPEVYFRRESRVHLYRYVRVKEHLIRIYSPAETRARVSAVGVRTTSSLAFAPNGFEQWTERLPDDKTLESGYSGIVYLAQPGERPELNERIGFLARWENAQGLAFNKEGVPSTLPSLEEAVAWARERTAVVIISSGPPEYEYWSAGTRSLDELALPDWAPAALDEPARTASPRSTGIRRSETSRLSGRTFRLDMS